MHYMSNLLKISGIQNHKNIGAGVHNQGSGVHNKGAGVQKAVGTLVGLVQSSSHTPTGDFQEDIRNRAAAERRNQL
jgi:hypothetical protein